MSNDENRISDQIDAGEQLRQEFEAWLSTSDWDYIHPLKTFQHRYREVFKTYDELKSIWIINRQKH